MDYQTPDQPVKSIAPFFNGTTGEFCFYFRHGSLKLITRVCLRSFPVVEVVRFHFLSIDRGYFAESTEAYFGVNEFYPFVRTELQAHDPTMYSLMVKVWGPIP